jgi:hypothetical protein
MMRSSSSEEEDKSITGAFPEPPPPTQTPVSKGAHEEISDGDLGGGGDLDGTGGGVLVSLGDGLPSLEGEHERLVSLFSSIVG